MNVLVAPDKFKGTLTARAAAEAIARGWRRARPADSLALLPLSDGGEGFGELMGEILGAEPQSAETVDAAHRPIRAEWWWAPQSRTALVESARAVGLSLLPPGKFHPYELDTFGLGSLLRAAAAKGAARCLVGIGGSATNDGGFGLARALGWHFFNKHDEAIERWTALHGLSHLHAPEAPVTFPEFVVAVDVQNTLLGPAGCTRIYGPQKGIKPEDFEFAERCLGKLAEVVNRQLGIAADQAPGAGAAGGLGFGFSSFAGARLEPGFGVFARHAELERNLPEAQVVLTGEGAIDSSTGMGKGVGELARLCLRSGVPCIGLAGRSDRTAKIDSLFARVYSLTPEFTSVEQALAEPAHWLERLAEHAAWRFGPPATG